MSEFKQVEHIIVDHSSNSKKNDKIPTYESNKMYVMMKALIQE